MTSGRLGPSPRLRPQVPRQTRPAGRTRMFPPAPPWPGALPEPGGHGEADREQGAATPQRSVCWLGTCGKEGGRGAAVGTQQPLPPLSQKPRPGSPAWPPPGVFGRVGERGTGWLCVGREMCQWLWSPRGAGDGPVNGTLTASLRLKRLRCDLGSAYDQQHDLSPRSFLTWDPITLLSLCGP